MQELARAKVNLSLHVLGRRADGMHLLDSIVVFPEIGDVVRLTDGGFTISGPFGSALSTTDNLVLKTGALMGRPSGYHLEKNLPVASGIGGGSADAAAVVRLLFRGELPDMLPLGADIPACVISRPLRMQGVGEHLTRLPPLPGFSMVLANSGAAVSTAAVFNALKNIDNPPAPDLPAWLELPALFSYLAALRNDLQDAAISLCPDISLVLRALSDQPDCALARMSGSGGTCFGLFETLAQAKQAAQVIKRQNPDWWVVAARG